MANINIAIADDHTLFREGLRMILSEMPAIYLAVEARDGLELLSEMASNQVDVVLLDLQMNGLSGIQTLKEIRQRFPETKVIILSMNVEPRMVRHLMELGANGYLIKDCTKETLEKAIFDVHEHGVHLNDYLSYALLVSLKTKAHRVPSLSPLSTREHEVLQLICAEFTTQQIAEKLFISERTVEGHRKNLCIKLDAKNTAGLVKKAIALKYVDV